MKNGNSWQLDCRSLNIRISTFWLGTTPLGSSQSTCFRSGTAVGCSIHWYVIIHFVFMLVYAIVFILLLVLVFMLSMLLLSYLMTFIAFDSEEWLTTRRVPTARYLFIISLSEIFLSYSLNPAAIFILFGMTLYREFATLHIHESVFLGFFSMSNVHELLWLWIPCAALAIFHLHVRSALKYSQMWKVRPGIFHISNGVISSCLHSILYFR